MRTGKKEKRAPGPFIRRRSGGAAGVRLGVARAFSRHGEGEAWRVGPAGQSCEGEGRRESKRRQSRREDGNRGNAPRGNPATGGPISCWAGLGPVSPSSGFLLFFSFLFLFNLVTGFKPQIGDLS